MQSQLLDTTHTQGYRGAHTRKVLQQKPAAGKCLFNVPHPGCCCMPPSDGMSRGGVHARPGSAVPAACWSASHCSGEVPMCRSCARKPSGFSTEVDPRIMSLPVFLDSSCTARISLLVTPPATNTIRRRPCDIDPSPNPCMAPRIPDGALAASVALPLRAQDGAERLVRALVMRKPSRLPKSSLSSGSLIGLACQQHQHTAMKAHSRAAQQQL